MIQKLTTITLLLFVLIKAGYSQESLPIVPYPQNVESATGYFELNSGVKIVSLNEELKEAAELLRNDLYTLYKVILNSPGAKAEVALTTDSNLKEEEYSIDITTNKITIKGGSYNAVCMGVTSVLQMVKIENGKLLFPICKIEDQPDYAYRGVMLDVARQWHNIETVKQVVELCRWYKIRYMQIHLTDDQSFTFPSTAYPKLASKDRHYTLDELKDLVEFARQRGVIIIPEFDAPGHTSEMRKNMPELFGELQLGVVDMTNEKVYTAMETIMKEMMDVFYTSPYFHIGADEAWLGEFEKYDAVDGYVEKMGFDNVHDIYLNFIVRMHNILKKYNKKTLVWESFAGTGSRKVQIPKDITVFAWETAYQRPDSLIENGYNIINASWKPAYVTPGKRWSQSYTYNWNIRRWENHWNVTPSYHKPIQLDDTAPIVGGQFCSWELSELAQIASIHQRVPAISEVFWNGNDKKEYADFHKRYQSTDEKFQRLIFPVNIVKEGFTEPEYEGIYLNKENRFADTASLTFSAFLPKTKITYTTDGSVPQFDSEECLETITLNDDKEFRFAVFKNDGKQIGYKIARYELNAIKPVLKGNMLALRDTDIIRHKVEFLDQVELSFDQLKQGVEIRYTFDNSTPQANSELYTSPVIIDGSKTIKVRSFYKGRPYGMSYECEFEKKSYKKTLTTGQKTSCSSSNYGYGPEKAVDGFIDTNEFWDASPYPQWWMTEFEQPQEIQELQLNTYWDGSRYYQYTIEVSVDGKHWKKVVDASDNKALATEKGYKHSVEPMEVKFIRVNMLKNSANKGVHIIEFGAN